MDTIALRTFIPQSLALEAPFLAQRSAQFAELLTAFLAEQQDSPSHEDSLRTELRLDTLRMLAQSIQRSAALADRLLARMQREASTQAEEQADDEHPFGGVSWRA